MLTQRRAKHGDASCKMNEVTPREWLKDVLERIPEYNIQNLEELLLKNLKISRCTSLLEGYF